jgi:hypothetical protein
MSKKITIIWGTENDQYNYVLRNANRILNDPKYKRTKRLRKVLNRLESINKVAILN